MESSQIYTKKGWCSKDYLFIHFNVAKLFFFSFDAASLNDYTWMLFMRIQLFFLNAPLYMCIYNACVCVCVSYFYEFESSLEIKINSTPFFPFTLVMISIYSYISYTYFIVLIIFSH